MKVALCVGHSRKINGKFDGGSDSVDGYSERFFNSIVANEVKNRLEKLNIEAEIFSDYGNRGYNSAMRYLAGLVRNFGANIAVELHFNCGDGGIANGHEWLFWSGSKPSEKLANGFKNFFQIEFPFAKSRGLKAIKSGENGAGFLRLTHCPAIICEPFFGSNPSESSYFRANIARLADAYTSAIASYFE